MLFQSFRAYPEENISAVEYSFFFRLEQSLLNGARSTGAALISLDD